MLCWLSDDLHSDLRLIPEEVWVGEVQCPEDVSCDLDLESRLTHSEHF